MLDATLAVVVPAFAELVVADPALGVGEIDRRPVAVTEGAPDLVIRVERDGVRDVQLLGRTPDVVDVLLERELRGMDSDDDQLSIFVLLGPAADIGERA